ncbi:MAG: hypothetical protein AYK18_02775 [Theionarchaea archaeon DG-70]|nr:MAG: hypothetical protein AYK18_02775 [Theionarchaea archaeon DG-70]
MVKKTSNDLPNTRNAIEKYKNDPEKLQMLISQINDHISEVRGWRDEEAPDKQEFLNQFHELKLTAVKYYEAAKKGKETTEKFTKLTEKIKPFKDSIEQNKTKPEALKKIADEIKYVFSEIQKLPIEESKKREQLDICHALMIKLNQYFKEVQNIEKLRDEWRRELQVIINTLNDMPKLQTKRFKELPPKRYVAALHGLAKLVERDRKYVIGRCEAMMEGVRKNEPFQMIFTEWWQAGLVRELQMGLVAFERDEQSFEKTFDEMPPDLVREFQKYSSAYNHIKNLNMKYKEANLLVRRHYNDFMIPLRIKSTALLKPKRR